MVFREITAGYSENHTIRKIYFENKLQSFFIVK